MPFVEPTKNINYLDLKEGWKVADFGTGTGFYALALAKRVGEKGRVYAIDVQKDLLSALANKAKADGLGNIDTIWSDLDENGGAMLGDGSIDACVVSNILFQAEKKEVIASEAARITKSGGQVLVIDWSGSHGGVGPMSSQVVTRAEAERLFMPNSFVIDKEFDAGDHHWGVVFKKI
ncbi:MAG: methyltransferase domain-containing protein [Candidatus Paceibacterota bacterium]|jgi:ubiquinone/menaquinone biosynthesis C-methylase UbiE